jgi:hypothetical protein
MPKQCAKQKGVATSGPFSFGRIGRRPRGSEPRGFRAVIGPVRDGPEGASGRPFPAAVFCTACRKARPLPAGGLSSRCVEARVETERGEGDRRVF